MATTQKRKAVSKTRKRTITIEDEVLSLSSSPMTKTVKGAKKKVVAKKPTVKKAVAKKVVAQKSPSTKKKPGLKKVASKPTAKKATAKKTPARKTVAKKSTARAVRTRKPATIRETIAAEVRAVQMETKHIAKNPTVHAMVRFSELYVLSVLITVIILTTVAWTQTVLNML